MNERRRHRSASLDAALELFLDACRQRAGAEALLVADDHGFLVGSAAAPPRDLTLEAALLLHPRAKRHSFRVGPHQLHVGGLGLSAAAASRALAEAAQGVARILA
jgi:hypothetical protein